MSLECGEWNQSETESLLKELKKVLNLRKYKNRDEVIREGMGLV